MDIRVISSSFLSFGTVGGVGIYFWATKKEPFDFNSVVGIKDFKNIPISVQKLFPFSNKEIPDTYDLLWMFKKRFIPDKDKSPNPFNKGIKFSKKTDSYFDCFFKIKERNNVPIQGEVCHIFEVVPKGAKVETDTSNTGWKSCPTDPFKLKPVSFENMQNGEYEENLPEVFLIAGKFKKNLPNKEGSSDKREVSIYSTNNHGNDSKKAFLHIDWHDKNYHHIHNCTDKTT